MRSELFEEAWKQNRHVWESTKCLAQAMYLAGEQHQQSKVDELEHKAKLRESDHKALLVKYQATKKCWEDISKEKDELQKRVDAVKQLIQEYRDPPTEDKTFCHALSIVAYELEQALKGESNESST